MNIAKPNAAEYNAFYQGYVDEVIQEGDIMQYLKTQRDEVVRFYEGLSQDKIEYAYEEGKWTMKQMLRHLIDAERVFGYRAMAIARGDKTQLPGFSEDDYVVYADDTANTIQDLITEFIQVRNANMSMIQNLNAASLARVGSANGSDTSARAIVYIVAGHLAHHLMILKERYL
ncbi:DinB family protein [Reichenbachiella agarivorans]|uniref:DinB family protein n=1 Tax=Reichenbachiella agarivorans TaxID=2979464 RepID=A0ABY6CLE3_9BACT|nr:DinB family protein [Reichenbachiella agarivorans]UXP31341.1 DinB family protein [Reichenbachiella agarivorans]